MARYKQYSCEHGIMIPADFTKQAVRVHCLVVVQEIYCNSGGTHSTGSVHRSMTGLLVISTGELFTGIY